GPPLAGCCELCSKVPIPSRQRTPLHENRTAVIVGCGGPAARGVGGDRRKRRVMRRLTALLALATFVIAVAGCGGSKQSASETSTSTSTTTESTSSTTSTGENTTTTEASGATTPNFASGKCKDLAA